MKVNRLASKCCSGSNPSTSAPFGNRSRPAGIERISRIPLRPAASDELPIIGASREVPGLYYATAHYRNGVLLAPLTAMLIADLLINDHQRPELDLVRPDRFGL